MSSKCAEVMGSNPVESPEFFRLMRQLLKIVQQVRGSYLHLVLTMEEISPFKHPLLLPLIEFPEYLFYLYRHIRFLCCVMKNISSVKKWQYSHSVMKSKICGEQMRLHTINYPAPTCGKWLSSSSNASSPIGLLKNKSYRKKKHWLNACLLRLVVA